ncbi:hypothetical protein BC332_24005 [Capsicum chinense]|nr:hypothetical protein BC332_24005 [Capsicum chinense]
MYYSDENHRFDAIVSADAFKNLKLTPELSFVCCIFQLNQYIAMTTTLSEDTLKAGEPSLIRKEISNISIEDILNGGYGSHSI